MKQHHRFPSSWKRAVATAAVPLAFALSCFSPKLSHAQGREAIAEQGLTETTVRSRLGKDCPDALVKAILERAGDAKGDLKKCTAALERIRTATKYAEYNAREASEALGNEKVARLFVRYPDKFVEIARAAEGNFGFAFKAFGNERIAGLFAKYPDNFVEIAKAAGYHVQWAFRALENEKMAAAFASEPGKTTRAFSGLARAMGGSVHLAFEAFENESIAMAFLSEPGKVTNAFSGLAKAMGKMESLAFETLRNETIGAAFASEPGKVTLALSELVEATGNNVRNASRAPGNGKMPAADAANTFARAFFELTSAALNAMGNGTIAGAFAREPRKVAHAFVEITEAMGDTAIYAFHSIGDEKTAAALVKYTEGKITKRQLMTRICAFADYAIEIGRPLDDLHEHAGKRKKYLASLTTERVFGLLLSDPGFFYTTTNHMLFDRLKTDMRNRTMSGMFDEYGCDQEMIRNFIFRAINYGRFYGRSNSLLNDSDIAMAKAALLGQLENNKFDYRYFFLLANSFNALDSIPRIRKEMSEKLAARLEKLRAAGKPDKDNLGVMRSIEFLLYQADYATNLVSEENKNVIRSLRARSIFDPANYQNQGKITVVQVFDRKDTEKGHWKLSRAWFARYGKPTTGPAGELVYETASARIILFMGDKPEDNRQFASSALSKNPNQVITFRGHSGSLSNSFPPGIFENRKSNIMFIPGNCGSAGSTADYVSQNPDTNLLFFSYNSTGRGQVTNALVDALLAERSPLKLPDILAKHEGRIRKNGGDISTIVAFSAGEALLAYVNAAPKR
jgi:hypothetical protein